MINVNNFKPGITFMHDQKIFTVLEAQHSKQGRGQASVKVKVKDLRSGAITMKTFTGGDKVTKAHIEKKPMNYLYDESDNIVLMDNETFEQISIPFKNVSWEKNFLKSGDNVQVKMFNNEVLGIEIPLNIELLVTNAPEAIKGNTQNNPQKMIELETGFQLEAPMFIKNGEKIIVSSETGKYVGRGK